MTTLVRERSSAAMTRAPETPARSRRNSTAPRAPRPVEPARVPWTWEAGVNSRGAFRGLTSTTLW